MSHIVTHTHIPVASKQLNSNEVRNTMKRIFVIVYYMTKLHQYCMQLHKYAKAENCIPIAYIYMTICTQKTDCLFSSVCCYIELTLKKTTLIVLAMKTANCYINHCIYMRTLHETTYPGPFVRA